MVQDDDSAILLTSFNTTEFTDGELTPRVLSNTFVQTQGCIIYVAFLDLCQENRWIQQKNGTIP